MILILQEYAEVHPLFNIKRKIKKHSILYYAMYQGTEIGKYLISYRLPIIIEIGIRHISCIATLVYFMQFTRQCL